MRYSVGAGDQENRSALIGVLAVLSFRYTCSTTRRIMPLFLLSWVYDAGASKGTINSHNINPY